MYSRSHRIGWRILAWSLCGGENEQRKEEEEQTKTEAATATTTKIAINSNYFHKGKEKEVPDVSRLRDHEPYRGGRHNGTISSPRMITAN